MHAVFVSAVVLAMVRYYICVSLPSPCVVLVIQGSDNIRNSRIAPVMVETVQQGSKKIMHVFGLPSSAQVKQGRVFATFVFCLFF